MARMSVEERRAHQRPAARARWAKKVACSHGRAVRSGASFSATLAISSAKRFACPFVIDNPTLPCNVFTSSKSIRGTDPEARDSAKLWFLAHSSLSVILPFEPEEIAPSVLLMHGSD
jgi:hypothetical protein